METLLVQDDLQLNRYVVENSQVGKKSLVTRLPQDGVYRIEIAGVLDGKMTALAEFRIESEGVKKKVPFALFQSIS